MKVEIAIATLGDIAIAEATTKPEGIEVHPRFQVHPGKEEVV